VELTCVPIPNRSAPNRRAGWFSVDPVSAGSLRYEIGDGALWVPGVRPVNGGALGTLTSVTVHRSHLPLLNAASALHYLTRVDGSGWSARDERTKALGFKLRTTQHQAIDFITARRGTLLADEQRLGKTLTCLMSHDPSSGPLVIVAPLSTRAVWLGWIRRLFQGIKPSVLVGKKIDPTKLKAPIVFVHYDIVHQWQAVMPVGTFVMDEAHLLANQKSRRSKGSALLASLAEKVIAATGTPVWNRPANLWNIIGILEPGAWGSYYEFGYRYGGPEHNGYAVEFNGISNEEELHARLSEIMIRRLWKDVQKDLPPISRNILVAEVDEHVSRRLDIIAAAIMAERRSTAANLAKYRSALVSIKHKVIVDEARKVLARNEPLVIWTWHKAVAADIAETLGDSALLIHGDISPSEREDRMEAWRSSPTPKALVSTMAVAQVGIDLSHAHIALFAELDYTPAVLAQAEMRTFAPERPMNVSYVVANHFVDQRIVRALLSKFNSTDPLGLASATDAIDALRDAMEGPKVAPDMDRFLDDILARDFEDA
jgi:SWI/SNF-related matrix-associated actin-dependent regulator of chromatin subfamily A-like protein 1